MFPQISKEFPDGTITDRDKFRSSEVVRQQSSAVIALIDQMITTIDNPTEFRQHISLCVQKHDHLRSRGFKGENFGVCSKNLRFSDYQYQKPRNSESTLI